MTSFINTAKKTIQIELNAITALSERINSNFEQACELLLACPGRIIVIGMGKSGHIGKKIAATLASTGSPSFFVHPGEASHGDMGMITQNDVVLALSNSGNTAEMVTLLPLIKRLGIPLISMTGNPQSTLAQAANTHLDISVSEEACPLGLAPTSSTTATLVMGDALAIALLDARGFTADDFAFSHPGGALGKKLLLKVADIMHQGSDIPSVDENAPIKEALFEMSQKGLGMTTVINQKGEFLGVFTDGDLRRSLDQAIDLNNTPIKAVMTCNSKTISSDILAAEALKLMEDNKISALVVQNAETVQGIIHLHDLLKAGIA